MPDLMRPQRAERLVMDGTDTLRSVASIVKKARTSCAPISRGWRIVATPAMPANEETNPIEVSLLSAQAIVLAAKHFTKLMPQPNRLGDMGVGFHGQSNDWR